MYDLALPAFGVPGQILSAVGTVNPRGYTNCSNNE